MTYRKDADLEILASASDEDLLILVDYLIKDRDGSPRLTEELTLTEVYKKYSDRPSMYWQEIAGELQHFGGNGIANLVRNIFGNGEGVLYREILCDVCDKMKVNYNSKASIEIIEMNLLQKILIDAIDKMNSEELKKIIDELDLKTTDFTKEALIAALQAGILKGGFFAYQIAVIVANAVAKAILGRGLSLTANATITRVMGAFAGPIGIALTILWTLVDIAGPAYRVTIPAVVQVAYIRMKTKEILRLESERS